MAVYDLENLAAWLVLHDLSDIGHAEVLVGEALAVLVDLQEELLAELENMSHYRMGSHVQVAADVHAHLLAVAGIGGVAVVIRHLV